MKLRCTKAEAKFVFSRYSVGFTDVEKSLQKKKRKAGANSLLFLRLIAFFDGQWMNIMRGIILPNLGRLSSKLDQDRKNSSQVKKHHPFLTCESSIDTLSRFGLQLTQRIIKISLHLSTGQALSQLGARFKCIFIMELEVEEGETRNWQFRLAQNQTVKQSEALRANYMWEKVLKVVSELDWIRTIQVIVITTPPIIS